MKMFENLEKLIRLHDFNITIMEEKYGDGFLFGLDIPQNSAHLSQQTFHDLINQATSPGDVDAVEVLCELAELAERYPELLFVQAETLKEGLEKLEEKAGNWICLSSEKQKQILEKVNNLYSKIFVSGFDKRLSQSKVYEVHYIGVSGDADTGPLLEITTETDFQYDFKIGHELMVVTDFKRTFKGNLSSFSEESLKIRENEKIEVCIPFEVITHIVDYSMQEEEGR